MTIESTVQKSGVGKIVTLFQIDLSDFNAGVLYLTPGPMGGDFVRFDSQDYTPIPIEAQGFEWTGKGTLPRPTLKISSVVSLIYSLIIGYDDLLGASVTRIRTFEEFLDEGTNPDPEAKFPVDIYRIERKVNQNKVFIEWELSTYMDQEGIMLPRRQVLRDACNHKYRFWDLETNDFNYAGATCPYDQARYYNSNDVATSNPMLDVCSKKLSGCRKRFGENGLLPTRAFPGAARIR